MPLLILALAALAAFAWLIRYLNGGDLEHKELPPSWGDGGRGDDWYTHGPGR